MNLKYGFVALLVTAGLVTQSCSDFLQKDPLGRDTDQNFFNDANNAVLAINAAYDVASWDEGSDAVYNYIPHNYEWMFGDMLSDDSEKGSNPGDFPQLTELKEWRASAGNDQARAVWGNMYQGIYRANLVLQNIQNSPIDTTLKNRIIGEAHFLRGYFYSYLVRLYGGVPLFSAPVLPTEYRSAKRASVSETYAFIEADLNAAIKALPEKSGYGAGDVGRATKGAARGYLARAIMYQLGTDNSRNHTWQEVYDLTDAIVKSGQYSLTPNYAQIFEEEGENNMESVFEIQFSESNITWGQQKIGTQNNIIQNNRTTWGWGFNNPTQDLVNEFEPNDPRKPNTVYGNGDVVLGVKQVVPYPAENATGYLNRKAAIVKPNTPNSSPQNIRKLRYADVLLMKAEAAARTGKEGETRDILNQIRDRARKSTLPKGSVEGTLTYEPANTPATALPAISASVSGQALIDAVLHERRVELGMEALRFWDLVRTGRYFSKLPATVRAAAQSKSITTNTVNPIPVLPIPINEVQSWGLQQNPGY
ncbi:RagB/SusD family nutrient uptake outer membrane protein [Spirosoma soli]|uniref:RagB/SusD family nutrient uptake outer membrane protein n=1 Tax=Spirosoma soli TaxID=1770529 RepID=A0ABW5M0I3_9BACT